MPFYGIEANVWWRHSPCDFTLTQKWINQKYYYYIQQQQKKENSNDVVNTQIKIRHLYSKGCASRFVPFTRLIGSPPTIFSFYFQKQNMKGDVLQTFLYYLFIRLHLYYLKRKKKKKNSYHAQFPHLLICFTNSIMPWSLSKKKIVKKGAGRSKSWPDQLADHTGVCGQLAWFEKDITWRYQRGKTLRQCTHANYNMSRLPKEMKRREFFKKWGG